MVFFTETLQSDNDIVTVYGLIDPYKRWFKANEKVLYCAVRNQESQISLAENKLTRSLRIRRWLDAMNIVSSIILSGLLFSITLAGPVSGLYLEAKLPSIYYEYSYLVLPIYLLSIMPMGIAILGIMSKIKGDNPYSHTRDGEGIFKAIIFGAAWIPFLTIMTWGLMGWGVYQTLDMIIGRFFFETRLSSDLE